jgi:hypothetical protein
MFPLPFVPLSSLFIIPFPITGIRMVGKQLTGEEITAEDVPMYPILVKEVMVPTSVLIQIETLLLIPPLVIVLERKPRQTRRVFH